MSLHNRLSLLPPSRLSRRVTQFVREAKFDGGSFVNRSRIVRGSQWFGSPDTRRFFSVADISIPLNYGPRRREQIDTLAADRSAVLPIGHAFIDTESVRRVSFRCFFRGLGKSFPFHRAPNQTERVATEISKTNRPSSVASFTVLPSTVRSAERTKKGILLRCIFVPQRRRRSCREYGVYRKSLSRATIDSRARNRVVSEILRVGCSVGSS